MIQVPVWDLTTRLFHWVLALLVILCFFSGEDEGLLYVVHAYAGYMVLVLVVFRSGWGIIGSPHSRFTDFVHGWSSVYPYIIRILKFRPLRHAGHNPLGGWMIVLMMAALVATSLSGVFMVTNSAKWLEDIHEALGNFMQVLVLVHIAGVLAARLLTGEKLVKAMITGTKEIDEVVFGNVCQPVDSGGLRQNSESTRHTVP